MKLKKNAKHNVRKLMNAKQRIRGWLTKEDIDLLEEASKRVLKYPKNPAKKYGCDDCSYTWLYSSVKCPVCASPKTKTMG